MKDGNRHFFLNPFDENSSVYHEEINPFIPNRKEAIKNIDDLLKSMRSFTYSHRRGEENNTESHGRLNEISESNSIRSNVNIDQVLIQEYFSEEGINRPKTDSAESADAIANSVPEKPNKEKAIAAPEIIEPDSDSEDAISTEKGVAEEIASASIEAEEGRGSPISADNNKLPGHIFESSE